MNKLSKEKQTQLALVAILTLGVIAGVWFFVITGQSAKLKKYGEAAAKVQKEIDEARKLAKRKDEIEAKLQEKTAVLTAIEEQMLPPGNEIVRFYEIFNNMVMPGSVRFKGILGDADTKSPIKVFNKFPYAAAYFETVNFEGYYHDFGKLLAYLEENYPYMQFQVRSMQPLLPERPETHEYLSIQVRVVALVRRPAPK
jgi:Tfp pilus assembly protein PilO